jgi:hypothetical protein
MRPMGWDLRPRIRAFRRQLSARGDGLVAVTNRTALVLRHA